MIHKISIWTRNKKSGTFNIECHMDISEEDIEQLALCKYKRDYCMDKNTYEYSAKIDSTII